MHINNYYNLLTKSLQNLKSIIYTTGPLYRSKSTQKIINFSIFQNTLFLIFFFLTQSTNSYYIEIPALLYGFCSTRRPLNPTCTYLRSAIARNIPPFEKTEHDLTIKLLLFYKIFSNLYKC